MARKNWTSEKIFFRLLNNQTERTYWDNINELRGRPTKEVYERAYKLANSNTAKQKRIGIDVLAQLGHSPRLNIQKTIKLYFELLKKETNASITMSILFGIGHNNEQLTAKQVKYLAKYKDNPSSEVREGLVHALLGIENAVAINTLIDLSADKYSSIRNWATFGLGDLTEQNNPKIIKALWNRVKDKHQETKLEAILGLALRQEKKVKDLIRKELEIGEFGTLLFQAILALNDQSFLPLLNKIHKTSKQDKDIPKAWTKGLKKCIDNLKNNSIL